jgi:very-short-patch-repair endonuclease
LNLTKLRELLRQPICGLSGSVRHVDIPDLRDELGLSDPAPADVGSKAERVAAAFNCTPDEALPVVAERYLARRWVHPAERNELQDVLWAELPAVRLVKKHRRAISEALSPDDLYVDAEQFDKLICSLFVVVDAEGLGFWGLGKGLHEEIKQHVYRNTDWPTSYLFEKLGALDATDRRFALFLEGMASPEVRPDEQSQREFAAKLTHLLEPAGAEMRETGERDGYPVFSLVAKHAAQRGAVKHLIFASQVKPDLRFVDAINGDIEIVTNVDKVVVYDRPIGAAGLCWRDLQDWWARTDSRAGGDPKATLYRRLQACLPANSPPQRNLFDGYHKTFGAAIPGLPALLPEVWLHWDPVAVRERGAAALTRHRMDFLMLLPHGLRVVIEVDGKQHYAGDDGQADVHRYAKMVSADRELTLAGYYVFRFGGAELASASDPCIAEFFIAMFKRFGVQRSCAR